MIDDAPKAVRVGTDIFFVPNNASPPVSRFRVLLRFHTFVLLAFLDIPAYSESSLKGLGSVSR
jgi:hypothetical protein